jgi:hypothetical protein
MTSRPSRIRRRLAVASTALARTGVCGGDLPSPVVRPTARWFALLGLAVTLLTGCGAGSAPAADPPAVAAAAVQALPDGTGMGVQVYPHGGRASAWCVYRTWPQERVQIYRGCASGTAERVDFARGGEGEMLLLSVHETGGDLIALTYDARRNVPSGRNPGVLVDGVDVWRVRQQAPLQAVSVAELLPLGGFDNLIHVHQGPAALTLCAIRRCFDVNPGQVVEWTLPELREHEFVDLVLDDDGGHALVRLRDDPATGEVQASRFHHATTRITRLGADLTRLADDCVPLPPVVQGGTPRWRCAQSRAELAGLLRTDLQRMPHGGLIDYGASNLEGRMAWSQTYYLSGLLQLVGGRLPALAAASSLPGLGERLRNELELMGRHAQLAPDTYAARRYSLHREPLLVALHLGRIGEVLALAANGPLDSQAAREARTLIHRQMMGLEGTLEQLGQASHAGQVFASLRLTRGADLWCDGAIVPYNYLSGYASGLMSLAPADAATVDRAATMLAPLLTLEGLASADRWLYWWSDGRFGWTAADGLSVTTPQYAGYAGIAHMSYRSMDASAVTRLHGLRPDRVPAAVTDNLRRLVAKGLLLPSVNEELASPVRLDPPVALRFARSAAPWELQSQVWALEQLVAER